MAPHPRPIALPEVAIASHMRFDTFLQHARQLLGVATVAATAPATAGRGLADRHPSRWEGDASAGAGAATRRLDAYRSQLRSSQNGMNTAVATANQISQQARARLDAVEARMAARQGGVGPFGRHV